MSEVHSAYQWVVWTSIPLKGMDLPGLQGFRLSSEISLLKASDALLKGRDLWAMGKLEFDRIEDCEWFLVDRCPLPSG